MTTYTVVPPTKDVVDKSWIKSLDERKALYKKSIENPSAFWSDYAKDNFRWEKFWDDDSVCAYNYDVRKGPIDVKWFVGGKTNMAYNCLDRHIKAGRGDKVAYFWEGNDIGEQVRVTYSELYQDVCKMQSVFKKYGVTKGTKVTLYLPMVLALPVCMLACARMGAILNIVFAGFSATALAGRVSNCASQIIVTADAVMRGPKPIGLKIIVDEAIELCKADKVDVKTVIVYERKNRNIKMVAGRDVWYQDEMAAAKPDETFVWQESEDPLFLLYTSGSTGKPKGVVHTTGGYMVYASITHKYVFDYHPDDIYWCTADIGWVTGHTYIVFGPLLNHATSVMFEGVPTHPDAGRCWAVCEKYKVNIFYTAPTAIRALMKFGDEPVKKYNLTSLRVLGSVGEPINVEAWKWYHEVVGGKRCAIVDTWWQTETGGILITPLPGSTPTKPSSATLPFFGVEPALVNDKGEILQGATDGCLVMLKPHPGICRTVYGDHKRYEETYFSMYPGTYFTGDGCRRDEDGYYWITGRVDDVLNVSGHRLGTAEIENAINTHPDVIESAVVGYPHEIKGVGIYAYITLHEGKELTEDCKKSIAATVRKVIGPIATPDIMHFAPGLPKTRSGKIMRRILRKIANNECEMSALGDVTTLADPSVVEKLIASRPNA